MNLIKKIKKRVERQKKLEQQFADENILSYRFVDYIKAKVNYMNLFNGKKFKTIKDYKEGEYGK